jgi:hypothetical protein
VADKQAPSDNIDHAVSIPAAVKASAAAAQAAYEAAYGKQESKQESKQDGTGPNEAQTSNNGTAAPGKSVQSDLQTSSAEELRAKNEASVHRQEAPQDDGNFRGDRSSTGQSDTSQSLTVEQLQEDWERKYKALKGRHDRVANENTNLASRLNNLEHVLGNINPPPAASPVPTHTNGMANGSTGTTQDDFTITAQEVSDYGEEFLTVIEKKAKQVLMPTINKLQQENEQLKRQLGQVGTHINIDSKVKLEQFMDSRLNNWRDLNQNEEFLGWLAQTDPYAGEVRHNLLKQAYERNDSGRVLAFFQGFLADEAAVAPRNSNATSGTGVTFGSNVSGGNSSLPPKVPLERFAAPGRARTTASSAPVEKPTIRRDQIAAFYAQVAAGKYAGNDSEKDRLENMIFEAQREGRIT